LIYGEFNYQRSSQLIIHPIPLCISEIHTGNSVEFNFTFKKSFFPSVKFERNELNIALPQWSAALIMVGGILSYGLDRYSTVLEIQNKQLENQKLRNELKEQVDKVGALKKSESPQIYIIQENLSQFNGQIRSGNISRVQVNGETVYARAKTNP
jgi:hypothetical protein